ncbi:CERS2-like protein [Mya arenaria]|uniref:CERS2-like protein n=1 Tax=Mya arenaria TaxID=6604 RepID=A0ABY7DJ17_MYAAR|nr:CERS2-like protein [Mya arenaria]
MMSNTSIYDMLWDESIWFPVRFHHEDGSVDTALGWSHLVNKPGTNTYYPKVHDLHFGILVGVVLVIIRYVLETLLIIPLGYKLGIKKKKLVYVDPIPSLEEVYKTKKKPDDKQCMMAIPILHLFFYLWGDNPLEEVMDMENKRLLDQLAKTAC